MQGSTQEETVETLNDYSFPVSETEIERPNNLVVEAQLEQAVDQITPDEADVSVSSRMTRTVAEAKFDRHDTVESVTVSFRIFDDEENRFSAGNGWEVVVSCLRDIGVLEA